MESNLPLAEDPFSRCEERALINLLPPNVQNYFLEAHRKRPDLFGLEEKELLKILTTEGFGPGPSTNAMRMKFWFEYDEAQAEHRQMKVHNIWSGIVESQYFYGKVLTDPKKVAWILTKTLNYQSKIEEMHAFALSQLRKVLEADPLLPTGKIDPKAAEIQFKIFQALDSRVKGAIVQKTMNVHATVSGKSALPDGSKKDEIERRIKELERLSEKQQGKIINAGPIDVE